MKSFILGFKALAVASALALAGCASRSEEKTETSVPAAGSEHGHEHEKAGGEHANEIALTPEAVAGFGIKTEPVTTRTLSDTLVVPARVTFDGDAIAHISTAAEGRIAEIKVKVGSMVAMGDELLVVDSPLLGEAQNDYLQKTSAVGVAEAAAGISQMDFERAKSLYDGKVGPLSDKQRREAEYRTTIAQLRAAHTGLVSARNKLKLLGMEDAATSALLENGKISALHTIRSPIAGEIIERSATLGEVVGPATEALLVVADTSRVWVIADIPEAKLAHVHKGAKARIKIAATKGSGFEGNVAYVSPSTNPQTRTGQARIEAANSDGALKSGMFAEVEIALESSLEKSTTATLAIPEEAVQTVDGSHCVFLPEQGEAGHFTKRQVTVGSAIGDMVPVYSGLTEGENIVTAGSFVLKAELGKGSMAEE